MIKKTLHAYLKESNLYVWMMKNQIILHFNDYKLYGKYIYYIFMLYTDGLINYIPYDTTYNISQC